MKSYFGKFLFGFVFLSLSVPCYAGSFYAGYDVECYVDTAGNDWYWFCGKQSESCHDNGAARRNVRNWLVHGQKFNWTKRGGQGDYWCCNGSLGDSGTQGRFYQGSSWITKTETVTEFIKDSSGNEIGKCTWRKKTNICGQVDNPNDKCKEAVPCTAGTVWHAKQCAKMCEEGYAYDSAESVNCVKCDTTIRQGIANNTCLRCDSDSFFDKGTSSCVSRSSKTQVSDKAHRDCWLCDTSDSLLACFKLVSSGQDLSTNNDVADACSLSPSKKKVTNNKTNTPSAPSAILNTNLFRTKMSLEDVKFDRMQLAPSLQ